MLGDDRTRARGDEGDRGGDVEGHAAVAAGADGVESVMGQGLQAGGRGAHSAGGPGDFIDGLALGGHGAEEGTDLAFGEFAGKHAVDGLEGLVFGEILAGDEFLQQGGNVHEHSNQLRMKNDELRIWGRREKFSTQWKTFFRFFHTMEKLLAVFPRHGKLFSTLWKNAAGGKVFILTPDF